MTIVALYRFNLQIRPQRSAGYGAAFRQIYKAVVRCYFVDGADNGDRRSGIGPRGVVNSWIGSGQNQAVSPDQIQQVLGSGQVQALAQKLGVSPEQASATLSQLLPTVMDKLSPNGAVPEHSNLLQMGESLLASFGKTGTNG